MSKYLAPCSMSEPVSTRWYEFDLVGMDLENACLLFSCSLTGVSISFSILAVAASTFGASLRLFVGSFFIVLFTIIGDCEMMTSCANAVVMNAMLEKAMIWFILVSFILLLLVCC